ncbi:MerR family transcriptional regulator [Sutcliffiella horikoshii]|uniref:MerR family transcriptional regulator n=1 Tax=Sutcliffiella horikoshii TaxID=79883 RepID=A0A5D4TAP8_9BACI|nr:MerR family transcriptional regulator [Sutcliffiella horikoshii]TYS71798.1 MerR family transcriptional regulator [Sutcliffiella horikoshii]
MNYFSSGKVAKKLGVSLRTVRYYDHIELVEPTKKDDSGRRLYSADDILQLQKVMLLKETAMPLKDIQKVLNQITMERILLLHKEKLEEDLERLSLSLDHTHSLLNMIKLEKEIQWEHFIPLLGQDLEERRQQRAAEMEMVFSEEEQVVLQKNLPKLEDDTVEVAKWINIIKRIDLCLAEGKRPDSEEGQLIAEDVLILSEETFKGDAELAEKFWDVRKSEGVSSELGFYPVRQEVLEFLEEAMKEVSVSS